MVLEHSTSNKAITNSSVLDVQMMEEEENGTPTDTVRKIPSRKITVGREEQITKNNQSTSEYKKGRRGGCNHQYYNACFVILYRQCEGEIHISLRYFAPTLNYLITGLLKTRETYQKYLQGWTDTLYH